MEHDAQLFVTAQLRGDVRTEVVMGRTFRVVPATLVRNQVLNNNLGRTLLPEDEITEDWAASANGAPVVIDHPTQRGRAVSAREPEVLNSMGVGYLFRARVGESDGARAVQAEVFIAEDRASEVEDLVAILERLDAGETVELSTGFPLRAVEETPGVHNGEEYDLVLRPYGFDHLAVFAEKRGACSVDDGCGLSGNEDGGKEEGDGAGQSQPPSTSENQDDPSRWQRVQQVVMEMFGMADNQSDGDRRQLLQSALVREFGGGSLRDSHLWVEDVFSEDGAVVFEVMGDGPRSGLWRTDFEISEDGEVTLGEPEPVRRVTEYEPRVVNSQGQGEETMNREQMIAQLAERGVLDEEALQGLTDCHLRALLEAGDAEGQGEGKGEGAGGGSDGDGTTEEDASAVQELLEEIRGMRAENQELRDELRDVREATEPAIQERERERATLVQELAANGLCPFEEDELQARNLEELRKLRSMARGENYALQGGPKVTGASKEEQFAEPVPYYKEPSNNGNGEED